MPRALLRKQQREAAKKAAEQKKSAEKVKSVEKTVEVVPDDE